MADTTLLNHELELICPSASNTLSMIPLDRLPKKISGSRLGMFTNNKKT